MATLSNLMKTSPKVNEQVAGNRQNNNQKIDNKQDKESLTAWSSGRGEGGVATASKDANPLKHPAMIALNCPRKWGRVEEKTKTQPKEREEKEKKIRANHLK